MFNAQSVVYERLNNDLDTTQAEHQWNQTFLHRWVCT